MTDPLEQSPDLCNDPGLIRPPEGWEKPYSQGIYITRKIGDVTAKIVANGSLGFGVFVETDLEILDCAQPSFFHEAVQWCDEKQASYVQQRLEAYEKKMNSGWGSF